MSINAAAFTSTSAVQPYRPPPPNWIKDTGSSAPSTSRTGATRGSGGTNPFATLATDLQAALTALQSGNTGTTAATGSSTTDPLAKLQGDLQSLISKFQNDGTGQPDGTAKAGGAHHHHHTQTADAPPASAGAQTGTATASTTEPPSQSFVADVLKAFQANFLGGGTNKATTTSTGLATAA